MAGIMEVLATNSVSLQAVTLVLLCISDEMLCKRCLTAAEPELLRGNRRGNRAARLAKGSEALGLPGQTGDNVSPKGVLAPLGSCNSPTVTTVSSIKRIMLTGVDILMVLTGQNMSLLIDIHA